MNKSVTRLEVDIKRLLSVCEDMAQNNTTDDWRLSKVCKLFGRFVIGLVIYTKMYCIFILVY